MHKNIRNIRNRLLSVLINDPDTTEPLCLYTKDKSATAS